MPSCASEDDLGIIKPYSDALKCRELELTWHISALQEALRDVRKLRHDQEAKHVEMGEGHYYYNSAFIDTGDMVEGTVQYVKPCAAWIRLGDGSVGVLHTSQLSWEYVDDVTTVLTEGERVKVRNENHSDFSELEVNSDNIDGNSKCEFRRCALIPSNRDSATFDRGACLFLVT